MEHSKAKTLFTPDDQTYILWAKVCKHPIKLLSLGILLNGTVNATAYKTF